MASAWKEEQYSQLLDYKLIAFTNDLSAFMSYTLEPRFLSNESIWKIAKNWLSHREGMRSTLYYISGKCQFSSLAYCIIFQVGV